MINNESLPQEHQTMPIKKETRYKKSKPGTNYRKGETGDQATHENDNNRDRDSDLNRRPANANMFDIASGLIGNCVQVTVKNGARFQGTLASVSSSTDNGQLLELLLKNACDLKNNTLDLTTQQESMAFKGIGLLDITCVQGTTGKNVLKEIQEMDDDITRQHRGQSMTGEILDEKSWGNLEFDRSGDGSSGSSYIPSWDPFTMDENLIGFKTDFDEDFDTSRPEQSSFDLKNREQYWKSSAKTYPSKKPYRYHRNQSRLFPQARIYDQKDNQKCDSDTATQRSAKLTTVDQEEMNTLNANLSSVNIQSTNNHANTMNAPRVSRKKPNWLTSNPKNIDRNNKKWTRNAMNVNGNTTVYLDRRYSYKNDNTNNSSVPSPNPFKLNAMAVEFIPSSGAHFLQNEKPKDIPSSISIMSSSGSSSSTPQTPPLRNQEPPSLNEMFPAPFNNPSYLAPKNTEPWWPYGQFSYEELCFFISLPPNTGWLMPQHQNLQQFYYDYHHVNMHQYSFPSYVPYHHYHDQQYDQHPKIKYPPPEFEGTSNYQPYPEVFPYPNYYY